VLKMIDLIATTISLWGFIGQFVLIFVFADKGATRGLELEKYMAICMGPIGCCFILFLIVPIKGAIFLKSKIAPLERVKK
jgi:hypothetical protein